jgi:cystathionine gamma-synthase
MSDFQPIPLGRPIPGGPHSVSCSLPTMRSVRGYEEKDPEITRHLSSGYPRFIVHPFARELAGHIAAARGLAGSTLWLASSERMARELADHLKGATGAGSRAAVFEQDGLHGVSHPESPELAARAKLFLQHLGGFLSSREAEDGLVRLGLRQARHPEELFDGDPAAEIRKRLRPVLPGASDADILLANSGMNAVWAAFRAISDLQASRGRRAWVQLGWLYLDSIAILKKFTGGPGGYLHAVDALDLVPLEKLLSEKGSSIAGLVAEAPNNPLVQTPDVAGLAALCRRHGVKLILDPSVVSVFNVDLLRHADVVVGSLTKYTAAEGDVIAGFAAINPAGPDADALRAAVAARLEPVYSRDLGRLAAEIGQTKEVLARIGEGTRRVADFLGSHPRVRDVHWALHPSSRDQLRRVAQAPDPVGGMIAFSLRGELQPFYDRLRLPKGPSFGMKTTLICPFMYLAHYDLVSTPAGRAELAANGLDPDLLRLCVGTEPPEEIISALSEALGG